MFSSKNQEPEPQRNPLAEIETADLRRAENASEILFGLARVLEEYGQNQDVTKYVRSAANAVRDIPISTLSGGITASGTVSLVRGSTAMRYAVRCG